VRLVQPENGAGSSESNSHPGRSKNVTQPAMTAHTIFQNVSHPALVADLGSDPNSARQHQIRSRQHTELKPGFSHFLTQVIDHSKVACYHEIDLTREALKNVEFPFQPTSPALTHENHL